MKYKPVRIFIFILWIFSFYITAAVPAKGSLTSITLRDGKSIRVYLTGDESYHVYSSEDNYTLLYNNEKGFFEYAVLNAEGDLESSGIGANNIEERGDAEMAFLSTLQKGLIYSKNQENKMQEETLQKYKTFSTKKSIEPIVGTKKFLVILVEFQDSRFTYTREDFDSLVNQIGYKENDATGSVRDYFRASSYGKFDIETTVTGPYTLPNNTASYSINSTGNRRMVQQACDSADKYINFRDFVPEGKDTIAGVYIIFAGLGQANGGSPETIWPHKGTVNIVKNGVRIINYACSSEKNPQGMSGIGTICHELGHMLLGLLDYYDTDYQRNGVTRTIGTLEIMDAGSYNNNEKTPPLYTSYSKIAVGWSDPFILTPSDKIDVTVYPACDSSQVIKINTPTPGEYFLLENKQRKGWDKYMYNGADYPGGMVVLHVDENGPGWRNNCVNCYADHPSIRLVTAENNPIGGPNQSSDTLFVYKAMQNNVFPGAKNVQYLNDITAPNTKSWAGGNLNVPIMNIILKEDETIVFNTYNDAKVFVLTIAPDILQKNFAGLKANLLNYSDEAIIERGFLWNATGNFEKEYNVITVAGIETGDFSYILSGLKEGTKYYFQSYAKIGNKMFYGEVQSFWTKSDDIKENKIEDDEIRVCMGGDSHRITGSEPIGGSGEYVYKWLLSTDSITFIPAESGVQGKDYIYSDWTSSLWLKRIVYSADKVDTSAAKFVSVFITGSVASGQIVSENKLIVLGSSTGSISVSGDFDNILLWERKKGSLSWESIPGSENKQIFSEVPQEIGTYSYRAVIQKGLCERQITNVTSILVLGESEIFTAYPNPTDGIFFVGTAENDALMDLSIFDVQGKMVFKQENIDGIAEINITHLESGVYILLFKKEGKVAGKKKILKINAGN